MKELKIWFKKALKKR